MCFSALWLAALLVRLVIIVAVVLLVRLLLPYLLSLIGVAGGVIMQAINIIIWAVVLIAAIWLTFDLISCAGILTFPMR